MATQSKSKWTKNAHSVFVARSWKEFLKFLIGQLWLQQKPDTLQAILVDKENLNTTDDEGRTALMWACESADTAAVRELNRSGANVRAKDKQGRTALMYAAARQSAEIVDVLLHSGAELDEEDSAGAGETAIHFSVGLARSGWNLFGSVADYTEPPTGSFYPHLFPSEPNPEVTAHLLAAGADPNAVDFEGATPLMYAAEAGTPDVLRPVSRMGRCQCPGRWWTHSVDVWSRSLPHRLSPFTGRSWGRRNASRQEWVHRPKTGSPELFEIACPVLYESQDGGDTWKK